MSYCGFYEPYGWQMAVMVLLSANLALTFWVMIRILIPLADKYLWADKLGERLGRENHK